MPARPCAAFALGLIVTVEVAWACALWSPVDHPLPVTPVDVAAIIVGDVPQQEIHTIRAGFGYLERGSTNIATIDVETGEPWLLQSPVPVLIEARSGWPFNCFTMSATTASSAGGWPEHGVKITGSSLGAIDGRRLPLQPIWFGLALNTVFFGTIVCGCLSASTLIRSKLRLAHGRCVACGYLMRELPRCPECGRVAKR